MSRKDDPMDLQEASASGSTELDDMTARFSQVVASAPYEGSGMAPAVVAMPKGYDTVTRIGPEPPDRISELKEVTERSIYRSFGIPPSLLDERASGTTVRESWRMFRRTAVARLAGVVQHECALKLADAARVGTEQLKASDAAAEARAVHVLTTAGMSLEEALNKVGLV